ncbi:hypothetical protein BDF22DRAFT_656636 [Syncephalis plumigaleata]|nr:hypothetical protein BDF22DRAFT_656636 [Syncephalis plumigaleata]
MLMWFVVYLPLLCIGVYFLLLLLCRHRISSILVKPNGGDNESVEQSPHRVYIVKTRHTRFEPVFHSFTYNFFYFGVDLDALETGRQARQSSAGCSDSSATPSKHLLPWWFDYGATPAWWRPLSICSEDYLGRPSQAATTGTTESLSYSAHVPLKEKLLKRLMERNIRIDTIERVELVTTPRLFGYAMNPASFYYCYERIKEPVEGIKARDYARLLLKFKYSFETHREFHVSPFNPRNGDYDIHTIDPRNECRINVRITMDQSASVCPVYSAKKSTLNDSNDAPALPPPHHPSITAAADAKPRAKMTADVVGPAYVLNAHILVYIAMMHPFDVFLTMPRILFEAWKLAYRHYLPVFARPNPLPNTIVALSPSKFERDCMEMVHAWLDKRLSNDRGGLIPHWMVNIQPPCSSPNDAIILPHLAREYFYVDSPRAINVQLHNYDLYTQLVTQQHPRDALLTTYATGGWTIAKTTTTTSTNDDKIVIQDRLAEFIDLFTKASVEASLEKKPLPWHPPFSLTFTARQWLNRFVDTLDNWLETRLVYFVVNPFTQPARIKKLAQIYQASSHSLYNEQQQHSSIRIS